VRLSHGVRTESVLSSTTACPDLTESTSLDCAAITRRDTELPN